MSMSGATIASQLITLAVLPIISRLYSPSDFGVLSLVLAVSGMISPALALKFDAAVLLPESHQKASGLVSAAIIATTATSLVWALVADRLAVLIFDGAAINHLSWWVFGTSMLAGLFKLFSQVAIRDQRYSSVAARSLYQTSATSAGQVLFGVLSLGHVGLLSGWLLGRSAGIIGLVVGARRYIKLTHAKDMFGLVREYWKFPVIFGPSALLNSLGVQVPMVVFAMYYGVSEAGQLAMGERIVAVPITLIGTALGQVFIGEIAEMKRIGNTAFVPFFLRVSSALIAVAILGLGSVALLANWIVPWALGAQWEPAGPMVQILALTGAARLIASPVSGAISVFQRARANLLIDIFRALMLTASILAVSTFDLSAHAAIWILYGPLGMVYLVTWLYVLVLLKRSSK